LEQIKYDPNNHREKLIRILKQEIWNSWTVAEFKWLCKELDIPKFREEAYLKLRGFND